MNRLYKIFILCLCLSMLLPAHLNVSAAVEGSSDIVYGAFGRDSGDASVSVSAASPYTVNFEQTEVVGNGNNILLEMYLAGDAAADKTVSAVFTQSGQTSPEINIITLAGDGAIMLCSVSAKQGALLADRWYKLSAFITPAGSISLYIDGNYVGEGNLGFSGIDGIQSVSISTSGQAYCDDVEASFADTFSPAAVTLDHREPEMAAGMMKNITTELFISPDFTVEELVSGLITEAAVIVRDSDGFEVDPDSGASMEGMYLVLEPTDGKAIYLKAETETLDISHCETLQTKLEGRGFVWEQVTGGIAGWDPTEEIYHMGQEKTSDQLVADGIMTSAEAGTTRDNGTTFRPFRLDSRYEYYPVTLEGSFYLRGGADINLELIIKFLDSNGAGVFWAPITYYPDGTVNILDGASVSSLVPDAWNHLSITAYPGETPVIGVRINGETVAYIERSNVVPRVECVKACLNIGGGSSWGEVWMAGWDTYVGAYHQKVRSEAFQLDAFDEDIQINGDSIMLRRAFSAEELIESLYAGPDAQIRVIQAMHPKATVTDLATPVTGSYALAVEQNGLFKYYAIETDENIPIISFVNYSNGQTVQLSRLEPLETEVISNSSVTQVTLYINNILTETLVSAPYTFDLSSAGTGTHKIRVRAENSAGGTSESTFTLHVTNAVETVIAETDFENYTSGVPSVFSSSAIQKGYMEAGSFGSGHGNSFVIGIDKNRVTEEHSQGAWVGLNTTTSPRFVLQFDVYLDGNNNFELNFKTGSLSPVAFIQFQKDTMAMMVRDTQANIGYQSIPYSYRTWYTLRMEFDTAEHRVDTYLFDQGGGLMGQVLDCPVGVDHNPPGSIRFCGGADENESSIFVIDNLRYSTVEEAAEIVSVGYDGIQAEQIDIAAKQIDAYVSKGLSAGTVSADTVKLFDGEIELNLRSVTYDAANSVVSVEPGDSLQGSTEYTLRFTEDVRDAAGMTARTAYTFSTQRAPVAFENGTLAGNTFSCRTINSSDEQQTAYLIMNVMNGNEIVATKVYRYIAAPGESTWVSYQLPDYDAGQQVCVYIWDSLLYPKAYASFTTYQ